MFALVASALLVAAPQDPGSASVWERNRAVLVAEARAGLARGRAARVAARASVDTLRDWQRRTGDALRVRCAPLPPDDRGAPAVVVTRTVPRDGYRVEHLRIESRPGMHVTAHLWVPDSASAAAPAPGVLLACGHSRAGKSEPLYQRGAATLARSGFVTLAYDPLDQGERIQSRTAAGRWGTRAHNVSGLQALLVGWSQAGLQAFDSVRCLDALAARPEVDAERLGVCGNSGGGTQSAQLFAIDERLRAAAPSCYLTGFDALLDSVGPQDCEQNLPGQLAVGLDHVDYLAVRAPTPARICAAADDFFPIAGTRALLEELRPIYAAFGRAEAVDLHVVDAGHGWHPELIEATARWFATHLHGDPARAVVCVADVPLTDPADRTVTASGRVLDVAGERSVFDLLRDAAAAAAELRADTPATARVALARELCAVRALDALPPIRIVAADQPSADQPSAEPPGAAAAGLERRQVETLEGMVLPAAWIERRSAEDPTLLAVGLGAWTPVADAATDPRCTLAAARAQQVLCVDPIALGNAAPTEKAWYGDFGPLARDAAICRWIDRPLLGLQVEQILAVARELARAGPRVDLYARGPAAVAALHAAAFEPQLFGDVDVELPFDGWSDLLGETAPLDWLPLVVPRALECYEWADLRAVATR